MDEDDISRAAEDSISRQYQDYVSQQFEAFVRENANSQDPQGKCEGCGQNWYTCLCSHDDDDGCGR